MIHFIDNTVALSALVNGYASKPDMCFITNAYHLAQFALKSRSWLEWVPSEANVADLPSRLDYAHFSHILPGSTWIPTVLPALTSWGSPFSSFARIFRARFAVVP